MWSHVELERIVFKSDSSLNCILSSLKRTLHSTVFLFAGECKDTLATIAEPIAHNTYGRNEGAWMKDPMVDDNKIYVANYYYGNNLLEFQNMDVFKQGVISSEYPVSRIRLNFILYEGISIILLKKDKISIKHDTKG